MIEYRTKDVQKGDILFMCVAVGPQHLYILVEVLDVRHFESNTRVEVSPIAGDRSCIWVDSKQLFEKRIVER
jgi:hypothetical protein